MVQFPLGADANATFSCGRGKGFFSFTPFNALLGLILKREDDRGRVPHYLRTPGQHSASVSIPIFLWGVMVRALPSTFGPGTVWRSAD